VQCSSFGGAVPRPPARQSILGLPAASLYRIKLSRPS
jgi:hypothetical protein